MPAEVDVLTSERVCWNHWPRFAFRRIQRETQRVWIKERNSLETPDIYHLQKPSLQNQSEFLICVISFPEHVITDNLIALRQSLSFNLSNRRRDRPWHISTAWHATQCWSSGSQARLFKYTAITSPSLHDKQQNKAATPPLPTPVFEKSIRSKIYSTYETDDPFMLQLQVRVQSAALTYLWQASHTAWSGLAHAGQTGSVKLGEKLLGIVKTQRTCGSSKFTFMFHSPTIRGLLRIVVHQQRMCHVIGFFGKKETGSQGRAQYCNPQGTHGAADISLYENLSYSKGFFISLLLQISWYVEPKLNASHVYDMSCTSVCGDREGIKGKVCVLCKITWWPMEKVPLN